MNGRTDEQLLRTVEQMHHCRARLFQVVPIRETFRGESVWEGFVHVFDVDDHPTATRAYAWSSPIEDSTRRRFFAVLHTDTIRSPLDAVRAAIVAEHRSRSTGSAYTMTEDWSVEAFYARVRASGLKPSAISTVFEDPDSVTWHVPDPSRRTPDERRAIFKRLERLRGVSRTTPH